MAGGQLRPFSRQSPLGATTKSVLLGGSFGFLGLGSRLRFGFGFLGDDGSYVENVRWHNFRQAQFMAVGNRVIGLSFRMLCVELTDNFGSRSAF